MKEKYLILGIIAIIGIIIISGCTQKMRIPNPYFSGYLFSVDSSLYFVTSHRFLAPENGEFTTIEQGEVLTGDKIKELTGLENIKPLLAKPKISKDQALSIAENKLSEIISLYNTKLNAFEQENCVAECTDGIYCGKETIPAEGKSIVPCLTDEKYCKEYCEQRGIALNEGYNIYTNATLSEPSLLYDQYGNPQKYEIFCVNSENIGVIFTVDASSGEITPSNIWAGDLLPQYIKYRHEIHPYSGLLKWGEILIFTESEAQKILQTYLNQHGIPGAISDGLYIKYVIKWGSDSGRNFF